MTQNTGPIEPTPQILGGDSPGRVARRLWLSTRPQFLTASVLPVLVGTAYGHVLAGGVDVLAFVLALLATACVHAASNVLNDVGDDIGGSDPLNHQRMYPFTGGSRFIQNGVMTVREMTRWGVALLLVSVVLGAMLIAHRGPGVLWFGLAGIACGLAYSLPPVALSGRGIGEAMIAVAFGTLPVCGAAWLQSGVLDGTLLLYSVPVGMWVTAILLINEVPDIEADRQAGKHTLPVTLGVVAARRLYRALHGVAFLAIGALTALAALPRWSLLPAALLLLLAWRAGDGIAGPKAGRETLAGSIRTTLAVHAAGCLLLIVAILAPVLFLR